MQPFSQAALSSVIPLVTQAAAFHPRWGFSAACLIVIREGNVKKKHYSTYHTYMSDSLLWSPRAHLHVVRMLNELAHSFWICSCVYVCLSDLFNCILFLSPQLSVFSLCSSGLISTLLALSTIYLFTKVSLSSDIILCGWLGLKQQRTITYCTYHFRFDFEQELGKE